MSRQPDAPFQVAILAGGQGMRLRSRTGALPKPMVRLLGRPLLDYQIELCRRHGFTRILFLVHYEHQAIRAHMDDGIGFGVSAGYQVETAARGTAGALRDALPRMSPTFLVLYGDTYLDVDLRRMWHAHAQRDVDATLFVHPNDHPRDSDIVSVDDHGFVRAVHPHPHPPDLAAANLVNAALYVLQREGLEEVIPSTGKADLARDTLPALLASGRRVYAYSTPEYIKDVGTPERLDQVSSDIVAGVPEQLSGRGLRRAVFLDRDGTLNEDVNLLTRADQLALIPGVPAALRRLNRAGYLTVVITNQSVVARGEVTAAELERIHARLTQLLGAEHAYLDRIYACPHHPDRGFPGEVAALKIACECRKPGTASIDAACRDLAIGRQASWLVGDTTSDVEAGRRAGLRTILVRTGQAGQDGRFPFRPDYVVMDLAEAAAWILDGHPALQRRLAPVAVRALDARLVLIGGLARSGKSFAAQVLRELLAACGRMAHVLSLDAWLKPVTERTEGTGVMSRFDLDRLSAIIRPLLGSRERLAIDLPVYDRARRAHYDQRLPLSIGPDDLIVIEGVPALLADGLRNAADLCVHVEVPDAERLKRLRADYRWRGESDAAVTALLASRAADETISVRDARGRADVILDGWAGA